MSMTLREGTEGRLQRQVLGDDTFFCGEQEVATPKEVRIKTSGQKKEKVPREMRMESTFSEHHAPDFRSFPRGTQKAC